MNSAYEELKILLEQRNTWRSSNRKKVSETCCTSHTWG